MTTARRVRRAVARAAGVAALAPALACGARVATAPVVLPPDAAPRTVETGVAPPDSVRPRRVGGEGDRRFIVIAVDDSTVTVLAPGERWLRRGAAGIAVDPRRRDALVARLSVQSRVADTAVALVTGQTTRLNTDHVAIFRRPETPVLREGSFWGGLAAGVAIGLGAALAIVRLQ